MSSKFVWADSLALWAQTCTSVAGTWQESAFGFGFQLTQSSSTVSGTMTFVGGCLGVSYGVNGSVSNGQFTIDATPNGHGTCFSRTNAFDVLLDRQTMTFLSGTEWTRDVQRDLRYYIGILAMCRLCAARLSVAN